MEGYLESINTNLINYIENNIFPKYEKYYSHGMIHIDNVMKNMMMLADYYGLDKNMAYVVACFHDIGLNVDSIIISQDGEVNIKFK